MLIPFEELKATHDWAVGHGLLTAWPTFRYADDLGLTQGVAPWFGRAHTVAYAALGDPTPTDIASMMRATHVYATSKGWGGALPTFRESVDSGQPSVGITEFLAGLVTTRTVALTELGVVDPNDVPAMFTAAADYAASNGFTGAIPTFVQPSIIDTTLLLFDPGVAVTHEVDRYFLTRYGGAAARKTLFIMSHPTGVDPTDADTDRWKQMLLPDGSDPSNVARYWRDLSFGIEDGSRTEMTNFLDIGMSNVDIQKTTNDITRREMLFDLGWAAAVGNGIDPGSYETVVVICTVDSDHGGLNRGAFLAYVQGRALEPTFMAHEIGHAMGRSHSSSSGNGEYGNDYDVMSAMSVHSYPDALGRLAGPGMCAIGLRNFGWLHSSRIASFDAKSTKSVVLNALSNPRPTDWMAADVSGEDSPAPEYFLEFRAPTGWDRAIGRPCVLVTTYNNSYEPEILGARPTYTGALGLGDELELPTEPPQILRVDAIDERQHKATITVTPQPAG